MTRGNKLFATIVLALFANLCIMAQATQGTWTQFPASFKHTQRNKLIGGEYLDSALMEINDSSAFKVVLIGDSHVKGKYLPQSLEATLGTAIPHLQFSSYGINGAWVSKFQESSFMQKVYEDKPHIVIISFGTNESHGPHYSESVHSQEMMNLICRIEGRCPGVKIILTTPPGSFISKRVGGTRRRPRYAANRNENTPKVVKNIVNFAHDNKIACWDIYNIAGGELCACSNWRDGGLMQSDNVHYTAQGYNLMGRLLGEAIIKVYFERVAN